MDNDLREFFAPASRHRLSVKEKEAVYSSIRRGTPSYVGSPVWRLLTVVFSRYAPAVAVITIFVLTGAGMTFADTALPGEFFYGFKMAKERIRENLRFSAESKAEVEAEHMDRRLDEASTLSVRGELNDEATADLDAEYRRERREAMRNILQIEKEGKHEASMRLRKRLREAEHRYDRVFRAVGKVRHGESTEVDAAIEAEINLGVGEGASSSSSSKESSSASSQAAIDIEGGVELEIDSDSDSVKVKGSVDVDLESEAQISSLPSVLP